MATYITQDGIKLSADSTVDLFEQLQQLQPNLQQIIPNLSLESTQVFQIQPTIDLDQAIAQLIQTDYLRVIDAIDG